MAIKCYLYTYLFTAHVITPSQVLCFCAEPSGLLFFLDFVVLFLTFLIRCVVWEIFSECSSGVLKDDSLIFLASNIFWTAPGILCFSTSGSAYPWPLSALVVSCHWPPLLPLNCRFVVAWGADCVPFLPNDSGVYSLPCHNVYCCQFCFCWRWHYMFYYVGYVEDWSVVLQYGGIAR